MDTHRIDSHKLMLHPQRVADWLAGKDIAPIYLEVSPSGTCNHRCSFCGMDFMGYKQRFLPTSVWCERVRDLGQAGVKAIMYAGEGEPFLHEDMPAMAQATKAAGIDVAFTTNAVLLTPEVARAVLPVSSWIKVSCNAGTGATYAAVHGTTAEDFDTVLANVAAAVTIRNTLGAQCSLGMQMVLLPENAHEAVGLAQQAKNVGADYLVIKPYSVHRQSKKSRYTDLAYADSPELAEALHSLEDASFSIVFRQETLHRRENPLRYGRCQALPFWGYVDSAGNWWGCLRHIGDARFCYGNFVQSSVQELLHGPLRRENMEWCAQHLDIQDCHVACRMDAVNAYLWELKHRGGHVNFI